MLIDNSIFKITVGFRGRGVLAHTDANITSIWHWWFSTYWCPDWTAQPFWMHGDWCRVSYTPPNREVAMIRPLQNESKTAF